MSEALSRSMAWPDCHVLRKCIAEHVETTLFFHFRFISNSPLWHHTVAASSAFKMAAFAEVKLVMIQATFRWMTILYATLGSTSSSAFSSHLPGHAPTSGPKRGPHDLIGFHNMCQGLAHSRGTLNAGTWSRARGLRRGRPQRYSTERMKISGYAHLDVIWASHCQKIWSSGLKQISYSEPKFAVIRTHRVRRGYSQCGYPWSFICWVEHRSGRPLTSLHRASLS